MEDAELLLSFVNALVAPASRVQQPTSLPPPAPIEHSISTPAVPASVPSPPQQAPIVAVPEVKEELVQLEGQPAIAEDDVQQPLPEQTQHSEIPPTLDPDATDSQMSPDMNDTKEDMKGMTEQKTRVYKGWPKGKPRGPRQTPYAKRGTKSTVKRGQQDGGAGQGSVSGSAGSPALSAAELPMEQGEDGNEAVDPTLEDILAFDDGDQTLPSELVDEVGVEGAAAQPSAPPIPLAVEPEEACNIPTAKVPTPKLATDDLCASCGNVRTSDLHDFWISCNGCKSWFHHTCVGFKTEREVKDVDKFYCTSCEPRFGSTTCELGTSIQSGVG
jgi:F-box/leucine-rich repeat protein 10/11